MSLVLANQSQLLNLNPKTQHSLMSLGYNKAPNPNPHQINQVDKVGRFQMMLTPALEMVQVGTRVRTTL